MLAHKQCCFKLSICALDKSYPFVVVLLLINNRMDCCFVALICFRDLWQPRFSPLLVFVASGGQLKSTYSLRSTARTATKNRAIAAWHCLLKNRLVKLESNTLNDGNIQKISLVVSLLARSFQSQLNRCTLSDPRNQVKITTKTYLFEVCRVS